MERRDISAVLVAWEHLCNDGTRADPRFVIGDPEAMRWHMEGWFELFLPFPAAFLAISDRGVVGWISGMPAQMPTMLTSPKTARIGNLWVHPEHRRQGLAAELVAVWSTTVLAAGYERIEVGTLALDERAVGFWKSQGFGDWRVTLAR